MFSYWIMPDWRWVSAHALTFQSLPFLMKYNTFNSWEPHGEREKRVINVTHAVSLVLPSRLAPSRYSAFKPPQHLYDHHHYICKFKPYTCRVVYWADSALCAIIITDKSSQSLVSFQLQASLLLVLAFILFLLLFLCCLLGYVITNIIYKESLSEFIPAIWPWQSSSQTGHTRHPLSSSLMHRFLQSWHRWQVAY